MIFLALIRRINKTLYICRIHKISKTENITNFSSVCPVDFSFTEVLLGHGSGGKLSQQLLESVFLPFFRSEESRENHDGARITSVSPQLAFTTDSFVVDPLFFPGGNIGKLSICGVINDLAMCGAIPSYLSAAFIIEEGFSIESLKKIVSSMADTAKENNACIVTGDTKVVEKGKADKLFISVSGVGKIISRTVVAPESVAPGDCIIINGDIGRHGIAVLASREGLEFECSIESDCASLLTPVRNLIDAEVEIHCMRDLTRGGMAAALGEIAQSSGYDFEIFEDCIPVTAPVRSACEMLGFDPVNIACEGRFVSFVPEKYLQTTMHELSKSASPDCQPCCIGKVLSGNSGKVFRTNRIGMKRIMDIPFGEILPRIC
ncbi:MAG: hydrogenase expression/formation protein HypE [Candidatus Riflebacteria bacterium]|nr:hydrogenase expression/formation protein HypE [Candidatus Riflebacteria bacterium]